MASIESLGIGSGLLTNDLVDNIINAERAATDLRIDVKEARIDAQISAYGALKSSLDTLSSAASTLSNPNTISKTTVSSSDSSLISGTSSANAQLGSFTFNVINTAKAHSLATQQYTATTDTVGTGTLTFRFGTTSYDGGGAYLGFSQDTDTTEFSLVIDSSNNTLAGIRDAINKENMNVTASIVNDGGGYRLLLTSKETGEESSMEISVAGDAGLQSLAYNSAQNDPLSNMQMTQQAVDANLTVNGLSITSASNILTEVIKGVTVNIANQTEGKDINLTIKQDTDGLASNIDRFLKAYNGYKGIYDELTKYNDEKDLGGILLGDSTLRNIQSQVRRTLSSMVEGITSGNVRSLAEIGITTDQHDDFKLTFDRSKFENVLREQTETVTALMASNVQPTDALISYVSKGNNTLPGDYDIEITQVATQGQSIGKTVSSFDFLSPVTVGGSNDSFTIDLDGVSADVVLEHGDYATGDDLALMIQNSINGNSTLSGRGKSISVTFNAVDQRLEFTSSKFGSSSQVAFSNLDTTVANTLGITALGQGEANGLYFNSLNDLAFGASTIPGSLPIIESSGLDFSANPVSFDLTLSTLPLPAGSDGVYSFTLDQNMDDIYDTDGNLTTDRDRNDVLSYIRSELVSQGLSGVVEADFNQSNRLVFSTVPSADSQTISLSNVSAAGNDVLGLGTAVGSGTSGVSVPAGTTFQLDYANRYGALTTGTITVPAATYETGDDLAAAIQNAINLETLAGASGAETTKGSINLGTDVDFGANPGALEFDWNGKSFVADVTAFSVDNITSIQSAINTALVAQGEAADSIVASLSNNGLVLSTAAIGAAESITITKDGTGASTAPGSVDLSAGFDFSASASSFSLLVDGISIDVALDQNAGTTIDSVTEYIQQELNTALASAGGGGEFSAGDILVKADAFNQIYFETVSKNGVQTTATYGAQSSIEITAGDVNLGIVASGPALNGRWGFGMELGTYTGFDSLSTVSYQQDADGLGRFNISFDNETTVEILNPSSTAMTTLGLTAPDGSETTIVTGQDVAGLINGVEATGSGQYLTASSGTESASNGYVLGSPAADFTAPVSIVGGTNDTLKITVDGIQSGTITLTPGIYTSGASLAAELKAQINADSSLAGAGKAVDVKYDPDTDQFGIFSTSTGKESTVDVIEMTAGGAAIFGISASTPSVSGKDKAGSDDAAAGLMLRVQGTTTGDRGSINFVQGIFDKLADIFDNLLQKNGVVPTRLSNLHDDKVELKEEKDNIDARIAAKEARLKAQFLFNDKIISSLKLTENFLTQQFNAMIAAQKDS